MELNISNRKVKVKTGARFLRELDKAFKLEVNGGQVDFGLNQLYINFQMKSISALNMAIYAGTRTNQAFKPTPEQIDDFLDEQEDIDWLFKAFEEQLRESMLTKKDWNALEDNLPSE